MGEAVRERELRRRCRRDLRALGIEPPLQVDLFCQRLGERRGRPIRLVSYSLPVPGPFGLWLATQSTDYILYQAKTTRVHQDHIILHEIGHILAEHRSDDDDDEYWQQMMPDLSRETIRRALGRTHYDSEQEQEAELVATIIMEWASVLDYGTSRRSAEPAVRRLQDALGDRQGWL